MVIMHSSTLLTADGDHALLNAPQAEDDLSIELPLTEIRRIALAMGFRLEKEERVDTGGLSVSKRSG
eukprot:scaffold172200_cov24-Tisochrysis_lutea.AAC.2